MAQGMKNCIHFSALCGVRNRLKEQDDVGSITAICKPFLTFSSDFRIMKQPLFSVRQVFYFLLWVEFLSIKCRLSPKNILLAVFLEEVFFTFVSLFLRMFLLFQYLIPKQQKLPRCMRKVSE